ncbi:ankyrin repeat domain-containing protein 10a [Brachyhypopomus gauderio]|uniref:ankyrin repeat domain-containing protein 10a n=1 Tax=Brachyhypopomus gauderio TaxID=698409 RepID=UPI004042D877
MSVDVEAGFSGDEVLGVRFPLHRACRDGDVGALCSLLQRSTNRADLAAEDSFYGWTPIHWAAHFGKLECVSRLVQVGCGVNAVTTRFAQTPAHIAAFGGHPVCLGWLLQSGADTNRQDYAGETPIHKAARAGSIECISALLMAGAKPELRNTNGLTAAELARAQGFQECAHLLTNAENQIKQLNGFGHNGADFTHIQGLGLVNRVANRKRHYDCSELNHVKKARSDDMDFAERMNSGMSEVESMHVESTKDNQSDDTTGTAIGLTNGHVHQRSFAADTIATNGHRHVPDSPRAEPRGEMCGSLHLGGSPSSCTAHRPTRGAFASGSGEHLHYGYYHGFGDTAEDLEDAGGYHEHNMTVGVEQHYDQEVMSAMQLFHGS